MPYDPNDPPIDKVMQEVVSAIQRSCAYDIESNAIAAFLDFYTPKFADHQKVASYTQERAFVLAAANQHGAISEALAKLSKLKSVNVAMFMEAGALVARYCRLGIAGPEGGWCS